MNSMGERIARLRKDRKMTQEELAGIIGVTAQSISKWENKTAGYHAFAHYRKHLLCQH